MTISLQYAADGNKARLAVNSVTLGDYRRPLQISQFIKDIHAGFQILNLKNDSLRRRSDSIKYSVSQWPCRGMPITKYRATRLGKESRSKSCSLSKPAY